MLLMYMYIAADTMRKKSLQCCWLGVEVL